MIPLQKQKEIIVQLHAAKILNVDDYTPFPKPYCIVPSTVKAIYLGCDPTNTKFKNRFEFAFALPDGKKYHFERFVEGHRRNLSAIKLDWQYVYVQNLCQNYFTKETSKNIVDWKRAAAIWIEYLKTDLQKIPPDIPVLLTSELLYNVLLKSGLKPKKAIEFYTCEEKETIPVPAEDNMLSRPLIPFYRHWKYDLSRWRHYSIMVQKYFNQESSSK